jgi:NADP-dependent 3-hydroxy acid dehydrogenase YdfG
MTTSRNVLVTGASSGIGAATAGVLAGAGHRVYAAGRRLERLEQLAGRRPGIVPLALDVTDPASIDAAVKRIEADGGGVDVVVNNAGYAAVGPVETVDRDEVRRQFAVNVFGLLDVTRAVLPGMRERGRGRLVNVSSIAGRTAFPGSGVYAASKYAVEALSDALRMEVAGFGVDVVVVQPGFVRTEITDVQVTADPTAAGGAYRRVTDAAREYLERGVAAGIEPDALARLVAAIVAARRPRTRYAYPARTRLLMGVFGALPDRAADGAKRRAVGLP